ncbi:MAG: hypothetical protein ACI8W3_002962, partial [Myxococcota bacterium]
PTKREVVAAIMDRSLWQGVMLHHLWAGLSRRDIGLERDRRLHRIDRREQCRSLGASSSDLTACTHCSAETSDCTEWYG